MKKIKLNQIITIISFLLFIIFFILYLTNKINIIDEYIYNLIMNLKSDFMTLFMKIFTFFGSVELTIIIIFISLILSIFKGKKSIIFVYIIVGETILNYIIKILVKRPRPNILQLVNETSYSFPSGHTMVSVVLYGFLNYLIIKSTINKKLKISLITILSIIPLLVMISRIYLGVHYFSDVMAGMFLSIAYLLIVIDILERKKVL